MSKYWASIKHQWKITLNQRLSMVIQNFQAAFVLFILFYFWKAVYNQKTEIRGYSFKEIVTYYFLVRVFFNRMATFGANRIAKAIKSGEITNILLKPISYPLFHLFTYSVAANTWTLGNLVVIPALSWFLHSSLLPPASFTAFAWFILVFIINGIFVSYLNLLLGSIAFWISEVTHLKLITAQIVTLLSGGLIPYSYFPLWGQKILNFLPFKYLIQFPISVYLGKISEQDFLKGLLALTAWSIAIILVTNKVFKKGLKIYESYN